MNFSDAIGGLLAELTPQPWDYTTPDGVTLTVIPAGLREGPGAAEVYVRITVDKTRAAQAAITTADLPPLITAIEANTDFTHEPFMGTDTLRFITSPGAPVLLVTEDDHRDGAWHTERVAVSLPEAQRLPLASALRRALDVAVGWEDGAPCAECPTEVPAGTTFCSTRCRNAADRHDDLDGDL